MLNKTKMAIKIFKKTTPGRRLASGLDRSHLTKGKKQKSLSFIKKQRSGRNNDGRVTVRHQGGHHKQFYRVIDWKRDKKDMAAKVASIEYDPNRTTDIALIQYPDGEKRYILAPEGLTVGQFVQSGELAPVTVGNALPLKAIPSGTLVHNLEILPGRGAQIVRGAGNSAIISGFEDKFALVKLPSGEIRRFDPECLATIGQLGNSDWKNVNFGKAGRRRHLGIRPTVRGTAQNPHSHPHGGGEGRSGEGMHPKTPWGKPARGNRTRSRKHYSNKLIVNRRK